MAAKQAIHTLPAKTSGWVNQREGSSRSLGWYQTKAEAQAAGRDAAGRDKTEHIIPPHTRRAHLDTQRVTATTPGDARANAALYG